MYDQMRFYQTLSKFQRETFVPRLGVQVFFQFNHAEQGALSVVACVIHSVPDSNLSKSTQYVWWAR